jgi:hypothetical protein
MRLRMSGVFLFVMALMSSCSTGSKSTDLNLDSVVETATSPAATTPEVTPVPPTAAPTPASTIPTTTSAVPLSTALTSSIPTSSTTSTSTLTTTIADVTTTSAQVELSEEDRVRHDFEMARVTRERCGFDPAACQYEYVAVVGSPFDLSTRALMAFRLEYSLRSVEGRGAALLRIDKVSLEREAAFVTVCLYDPVVVYDIADPTNPSDDIIYNEEKNSYETRWEMRQSAGRWLLFERRDLRSLKGGDLCGF